MQESILNQEIANLDFNKVAALQQKRTLAFVNHFVMSTTQFLNNFMKNCEYKLMHFEKKLEKVEASLVLLETRLSSIPEADIPKQSEEKEEVTTAPQETNTTNQSTEQPNNEEPQADPVEQTPQIRPEYERFIKMVQVGVPLQAVKLKVALEGLDPAVFETCLSK